MINRTGVIVLSRKYADKDGVDECLTFSENNTFAELRERLVMRYRVNGEGFENKLMDIPNDHFLAMQSGDFALRIGGLLNGAILIEYALRNAYKNNTQ